MRLHLSILTALTQLAIGTAPFASPVPSQAEQEVESISIDVGRSYRLESPWSIAGVSLTDPEVADVQVLTPQLALFTGTSPGITDALVWGETGELRSLRVEVMVDVEPIVSDLRALFPGANLEVSNSRSGLVVSGRLARADEAPRLKSYLDGLGFAALDSTRLPGVQQVQVKVKIAEVSRTALRSLGANAFISDDDFFGGSVVGPSQGGPINPVSIGPPEGASGAGDTPFVFTQDVAVSPAVTLFGGFPSENVEFFVQALVENQYMRVLAEPTLVALSGEQASFLAGGEFPIPVVQGAGGGNGGTSITIEFKEFGVGLRFRPVVLGDGEIQMSVFSEVSDISDIGSIQVVGFQVPAITTRRAETTLELATGQTFAIAGLLRETVMAQHSRIPGLGSLPILGPLFRSVRYRTGETELVVLVTAALVEPLSEVVYAPLPGEEHVPPTDWELYVNGSLEGKAPPRLDPQQAQWLKEHGLDQLEGPGAWAVHDGSTAPAAEER